MPGADDILMQADELVRRGRPAQAKALLSRALQRAGADPRLAREHGLLLFAEGQMDAGLYYLERAATAMPRDVRTLCCLGMALAARDRSGEAIAAFERALAVDEACAAAHAGLGLLLMPKDRYDEALHAMQRAIELNPSAAGMRGNLALCLLDMARPEEAMATLRDGLLIDPAEPSLRASLPFVMNYLPDPSPEDLLAAHRRLGESLPGESGMPPLANSREPDRRLRVGFLSPDLREHSVAYFAESLLAGLDRRAFDVVAFPLNRAEDATSARLKALCGPVPGAWRPVGPLGDEALVREIRAQRIDILVDLAGLTSGHRASALARRAAPVQVTAIGYPATTGVPAIDYRLVDAHTDPDGESLATEHLVRPGACFLCYTPPRDAPEPGRPPGAVGEGPITFGSFNALKKVNERTIDAWAAAMGEVPDSRLIIKSFGLATPSVRERIYSLFAARGIEASRIDLLARVEGTKSHLALYHKIDIALDTFPYHGTTTTCEALWMGVPVVTLAGRVHAARVGVSLLHAVGHPEWIAHSPAEFARVARGLAGDRTRLADLRSNLRAQVRASALFDAARYVREVGGTLRAMWRAWCESPVRGGRDAFERYMPGAGS